MCLTLGNPPCTPGRRLHRTGTLKPREPPALGVLWGERCRGRGTHMSGVAYSGARILTPSFRRLQKSSSTCTPGYGDAPAGAPEARGGQRRWPSSKCPGTAMGPAHGATRSDTRQILASDASSVRGPRRWA